MKDANDLNTVFCIGVPLRWNEHSSIGTIRMHLGVARIPCLLYKSMR